MVPVNFYPLIYFYLLLAIIFAFNYLIDYFLKRSIVGTRYRLFVAPGVIVHELSHAVFAAITGNQVKEINVTAPDGGYVVHTAKPSPFMHFSQILISLAPLFGVTFAFVVITHFLQPGLIKPLGNTNPLSFLSSFFSSSSLRWQFWLHAYLSLSLATSLAPSWQDIKIALPGLATLFVILLIISLTNLGAWLGNLLVNNRSLIIILLSYLCLALSLSIILFILTPFSTRQKRH